ncbi:leucine-rich_repeat domain-containing protein [Hexamita inflata]|uniref:Leucine-rich_repeat domain-containing protein n=1 Tax=Hexamita inflata TaxID=28002 RepID=A0ABP1HSL0_9EUKA
MKIRCFYLAQSQMGKTCIISKIFSRFRQIINGYFAENLLTYTRSKIFSSFQNLCKLNLTSINLCSNPNLDLDSLRGLVNLTSINLCSNEIQNVDFLRGLVNLKSINLWNNRIQNVEPLKELVNLKELDLSWNRIKDFSPIKNHPNFKKYYIGDQK